MFDMEAIDADLERRATTVGKVEEGSNGWCVTGRDGWSLFVTNEHEKTPPAVGEGFIMFGRGIGHTIRGVIIGGRVYRYETDAQERASFAREQAERSKEKAYDYEKKRGEFDARVEALPETLAARIRRFRDIGGDEWRYEFEPYELFVCEQAAALAATGLDIADFHSLLTHEQQKAAFPKLDDGHSGNTFGAMCAIARLLRERPELVIKQHGALCPLVGCKAYGCFAATAEDHP